MIRGTKSAQFLEDLRVQAATLPVFSQTSGGANDVIVLPPEGGGRLILTGTKSYPIFKPDSALSASAPDVRDLNPSTALLEAAADRMRRDTLERILMQPTIITSSKSGTVFRPEPVIPPATPRATPSNQPSAPQKLRPIPVLISSSKSFTGSTLVRAGDLAPNETHGQQIGTFVIPNLKPPPGTDIFGFTHVAPKTPSLADLIPDLQNIEQLKNAPRDPLFVGRKLTIVHTGSDSDFAEETLRGLKSPDERFIFPLGSPSTALDPTLLVPMPRFVPALPSNFIGVSAAVATGRSKKEEMIRRAVEKAAERAESARSRSTLISTSKSGSIFTPVLHTSGKIGDPPPPSADELVRVGPLSFEPPAPRETPAGFLMLRPDGSAVIPDLTTRIPGLYEFARPVRAMP